jgi:hypothetical protein
MVTVRKYCTNIKYLSFGVSPRLDLSHLSLLEEDLALAPSFVISFSGCLLPHRPFFFCLFRQLRKSPSFIHPSVDYPLPRMRSIRFGDRSPRVDKHNPHGITPVLTLIDVSSVLSSQLSSCGTGRHPIGSLLFPLVVSSDWKVARRSRRGAVSNPGPATTIPITKSPSPSQVQTSI